MRILENSVVRYRKGHVGEAERKERVMYETTLAGSIPPHAINLSKKCHVKYASHHVVTLYGVKIQGFY